MDKKILISPPAKLDLARVQALIEKGDEVDRQGLEERIEKAFRIAVITVDGRMASVGALKNPAKTYVSGLVRKSGSADVRQCPYELGWLYTEAKDRRKGFGTEIIDRLIAETPAPLFATTREKNEASRKRLEKAGFKQVGKPWNSARGDYRLLLFTLDKRIGKRD